MNKESKTYKPWDVLFLKDQGYMPIYDIEEKSHVPLNDENPNRWVSTKMFDTKAMAMAHLATADDSQLVPYHASMQRNIIEYDFNRVQSCKEKWGSLSFRCVTVCRILCNGIPIYGFSANSDGYAMDHARSMAVRLMEHSYDFINPEKMKGRKIYFYNLPATIQPRQSRPWEITIHPDIEGYGITLDEWWKMFHERSTKLKPVVVQKSQMEEDDDSDEIHDYEEIRRNGYINWGDAFADDHIWWHRK